AIKRRQPDIISLDPFVKTHSLEESDSGDMDFVCDLLARLAIEFNIAVDSPHHVHKGTMTPGDADSGRGSSGIRDAGPLVYTLAPMSAEEARGFAIEPQERWAYVRLDSAKVNIAARCATPEWFHIVGQSIGNATTDYPNGDIIQVVEPWSPPDAWTGTTVDGLHAILDDIECGMDNGQGYDDATTAGEGRQEGTVVENHCQNNPEGHCQTIIHRWPDLKLLSTKEYADPIQYKPRKGLFVDATKRQL